LLYQIPDFARRKAKTPHELFMLNLAAFHLLLAPAAIVLKIGVLGFLIPLLASLTVIAFTYLRSRRAERSDHWFVMVHWKIALGHTRILLVAYAISAALLGIGLLVAAGADKKTTQDIITTVFARVGAVPVLLSVMLCFVLESGSIYQAGRGEVPAAIVQRFPPPGDVEPQPAAAQTETQTPV